MMGNPRRDVFEYGVLMTITTSMAAAYAFLLAYSSQSTPDGQRRKLPKVNLDESVDISKAWEDVKETLGGLNQWRSSGFSSSAGGHSSSNDNSEMRGTVNSTKEESSKR